MVGIFFFSGQLPCRRERGNDHAKPHHRLSVFVKVGRIGESVSTDVGAVRVLLVWPPVVSLGEVVMRPAFAAFTVRSGYSYRLLRQISVCCGENPRTVGRRNDVIGSRCVFCPGRSNNEVAGSPNCQRKKLPPCSHPHLVSPPLFVQVSLRQ